MKRFIALVLTVSLCGCTLQRMGHDVHQGIQWVRLTTGSNVATDNRWRFSPALQIELAELSPSENDGWLTAARNGVNQVSPAHGSIRTLRPGAKTCCC